MTKTLFLLCITTYAIAAELIPQRVKKGFPGAQWPKLLVEWLATLPKP